MILVVLRVVLRVVDTTRAFVSALPSYKKKYYFPNVCLLLVCFPPPKHVDMHVRRGLFLPKYNNTAYKMIATNRKHIIRQSANYAADAAAL